MTDLLLKVRGLKIEGRSDETWNQIVNGVDMDLKKGEVLGLIGESGAGKSTVGRAAMGFTRDGCRLGFGKGHYDRALAPIAGGPPLRVGVCLHEALDPPGVELVSEPHDVMMHQIVTDHISVSS